MLWVLSAAVFSESTNYLQQMWPSNKSGPTFAHAGVGPEPAGVFMVDKMSFSLPVTKEFHLPQSVSSEAFQMLLLCFNHQQKS